MKPVSRLLLLISLAWGLVQLADMAHADDAREALDHFEREVRPILVDACHKCHGASKQESDLRLDSREALLKGGVSGPAVVPGDPAKSLLIAAVRHEGDYKMPPKTKLTEAQIAALTHWVKRGAAWPAQANSVATIADKAKTHWAFQPVGNPPIPQVAGNESTNPIDAFIRAKLAEKGLRPSPRAAGRTLVRRLTYDLTGLPPRGEGEKEYQELVEELLASPQYGEHWARHWLDVARYSDTKGYVYAREQRFWVHAWVYRDWVVQSLNDDLPYNRFLLLQIAADQAAPQDKPADKSALAALGFLTLGRRFLGVQRDIIDDRIDVVTRGTMGLTVGCARCHDHKYDPIPTRDYYSLYGVFQSCVEYIEPIAGPPPDDEATATYRAELEKRRKALAEGLAAKRLETANRNRSRVGDYLAAQLELHKYPEEGFDQILEKTDLLPNFVRHWQAYLDEVGKSSDSIFVPWHAFAELPQGEFAAKVAEVTSRLNAGELREVHPLVLEKFKSPPASMTEVAARYGELFGEIEGQWQALLKSAEEQKQPAPTALPDAAAEALRQVLYSAYGPCEVPNEPIVNIEYEVDSNSNNELWKLQNEYDNWILQSPPSIRHAIVLRDRDRPTTPRVFKRGNPAMKGDEVPRQFVSVVAGPERQPFALRSGRLELAEAIIDPANPLTARVIVNRVWLHHFGAGLVRTPSDFGTRAEPPSHPELLDWLTHWFTHDAGWSLKKLHRLIVTSETYQQTSNDQGPMTNDQTNPKSEIRNPKLIDPENRLLWRMNPRRLSFEEMRDSLLAASGKLDRTVGGRAGDLFSSGFARRSLYGTIDRQFLPGALRMFDFANPDLHIPLRSDTTVPQQALFFMNHPLAVGYARDLAAATASAASDEARVQALFETCYQRPANSEQVQAALALVSLAKADQPIPVSQTGLAWQYGYGSLDETSQRVASFEKLPHFTGSAWQGGSAFPDANLGWVQLTAAGGHPGNDLAHAAIRRWTAPADMQVSVLSTLVHEPKEGEGVRGFLVSSRAGVLKKATVHNGQQEMNVDLLEVKAGDTLDFVADIGNKLSHNQFLWNATITPIGSSDVAYDSQRDFGRQLVPQLEPWEQLAQVLLSANEFVFVD
jgi:hypothetical protein